MHFGDKSMIYIVPGSFILFVTICLLYTAYMNNKMVECDCSFKCECEEGTAMVPWLLFGSLWGALSLYFLVIL